MITITLYKCSFCGLDFGTAESCQEHEKICVQNPAYKTCLTCQYFWLHRDQDESYWTCDKKLMTYNNSRGDIMKDCAGWEVNERD